MSSLSIFPQNDRVVNESNGLLSELWRRWFGNELRDKVNDKLYRSYTLVNKTSNQAVTAQTETKVVWEYVYYNSQNEFDSDNNKWVALRGGVYCISLHVTMNAANDQSRRLLQLYKNGSSLRQDEKSASGAGKIDCFNIVTFEQLSKDDYLEAYVYNREAGDNDSILGTAATSWWSIYRLGE
jgi:hypothetical protein